MCVRFDLWNRKRRRKENKLRLMNDNGCKAKITLKSERKADKQHDNGCKAKITLKNERKADKQHANFS